MGWVVSILIHHMAFPYFHFEGLFCGECTLLYIYVELPSAGFKLVVSRGYLAVKSFSGNMDWCA